MLSRVSSMPFRCSSILIVVNRSISGRLSFSLPKNGYSAFRMFGTTPEESSKSSNPKVIDDKGFTPEGAVFTNPQIGSDWIYREEKDTGRKYYINIKTNEILYNRTRDSELAPRWRRAVASAIDLGISLTGGLIVASLGAFELGDWSLGMAIGRIYTMLFFAAKDCVLDHKTRSIGKKIMKLEIVNKHGELSGPYRNFFRNPLELFLSVSMMINYPMFMLNNSLVLLDVISFLIFKKRLFDFALGTRVVPEGTDHAMRVKLHHDKWSYKRQSEALEEGSMSAMQQMIQQQKRQDELRAQMEERQAKEAEMSSSEQSTQSTQSTSSSQSEEKK